MRRLVIHPGDEGILLYRDGAPRQAVMIGYGAEARRIVAILSTFLGPESAEYYSEETS